MKTITIVQRQSDYADDFANWLEKEGYRVRVCTGPGAPHFGCWSRTLKDCPLWQQSDLMIYDPWVQTGPRSYGSGAILRVEQSRHPGEPVLIWTSGGTVPVDVAAMEHEGDLEILPLEITPAELVATVQRIIGPPTDARAVAARLPG